MKSIPRTSFRTAAFCASLLLLLLSASLFAQEATGGSHQFGQNFLPSSPYEGLGQALAMVDDFDGDGLKDIACGSPNASPNGAESGLVRIYSSANGQILLQIPGLQAQSRFGRAILSVDDLDQDGVADLLISAPENSPNGIAYAGSVYAISAATGTVLYTLHGVGAWDFLGENLALSEDFDGDGIRDCWVSQSGFDGSSQLNLGSVQLISTATGNLLRRIEGTTSYIGFARAIASVGDTDGDGVQDLLVGAPLADFQGLSNAGAAFLYSGATGNLLLQLESNLGLEAFGSAVSSAGDVNQDGFDDLLIGATQFGLHSGLAHVFSGSTGQELRQYQPAAAGIFGATVATLGDINQDGFAEHAISNWTEDLFGIQAAGSVSIYSGADGNLLQKIVGSEDLGAFGFALLADRQTSPTTPTLWIGAPDVSTLNQPFGGQVYQVTIFPYLYPHQHSISATTGGTLSFDLDFPLQDAQHKVILLASIASPGYSMVNGISIPLGASHLFNRSYSQPWPNAVQVLNAAGDATAVVSFAANELRLGVGKQIEVAAVVLDPIGSLPIRSSVQASIAILP